MRIGLGCMRLSTEPERDEAAALATLAAAFDAGVPLFDTARSYATSESDLGHNERLLARAWRSREPRPVARIVTKCGMRRDGGAWIPDGRAKRIAEDVRGSVEALGMPIDLLLLHAPDPRVPLATSGRALARALDEGLVRGVGVSNVSRTELEELSRHVPVAAVEIALGAYDDVAIRGGVVAHCLERGIELLAHAPLGGPDRARRLDRDPVLSEVARRHAGVSGVDVFLAYLLSVRPEIVPVVGARRPETVRRWAAAEELALDEADRVALDARFPVLGELRRPPVRSAARDDAEVVILMGVQGAGKSRAAEAFVARGYERLNRDNVGGSLRALAKRLDARLAAGAKRVVLDNTYVTRATRSDVVRVASSHGAKVRCSFYETPLAEAQVNVVLRMLERFGRVVEPHEIASLARSDSAALAPHALSRMSRELERPAPDEGFAAIEVVPFVRDRRSGRGGTVVALDALGSLHDETRVAAELRRLLSARPAHGPCLLFAWRPGADGDVTTEPWASVARAAVSAGAELAEVALCAHPAGPPICWCRPPLPALFLAFAHRHALDLGASVLFGKSPTDRKVAAVLGASFVEIG
jgi:aryl-alcohol dehydrogenase-like predicted oxidoreductase